MTVSLAIVIGALLDAPAGYSGGWLDDLIMCSMDVLQAFPGLLLAIKIVAVLGPGLINALLAIAIIEIPIFAPVVRASVLTVKELGYIDASQALGAWVKSVTASLMLLTLSFIPGWQSW
jgi:ABC-type dipeptide/oligopeptide/nickel transport system permease subunit